MSGTSNRADPTIYGRPEVHLTVSNDSDASQISPVTSSHSGPTSSSSSLKEKSDNNDSTHNAQASRDGKNRYPRISLPVQMMRDSYDIVIIGTGYGGGVAASRFARARQSVCVLERGRERWPGEFPESTTEVLRELRVSGEFAPGDRRGVRGSLVQGGKATGLYHVALGDGQNVYTGNGLGGTSLVNANVFLEATPAVLNMEIWPEELRGPHKWRKYYHRASRVLEPVEYPATQPPLLKAEFLRKQASLLKLEHNFQRVKQTTRFHEGPNSSGVHMKGSTLTGMDATGINDGSKSSTLVNYLSDAWNWGAEMFCECEVRYVTKAPDGREGYIVYFAWHTGKRSKSRRFGDDLMWVHAKKLVAFGAGSLGTTEILLRSRDMGLSMSDDVGTEMSGNGDMLGFGYDTAYEVNCIARPERPDMNRPVGPCVTSVLDMRDQENPLGGFVVEDAAVPYALAPFLYPILELSPELKSPVSRRVARLKNQLTRPLVSRGKLDRTATYLVMSHDSSQGRLTLRHDKPVLNYSGVGRSDSVSRIHTFLETMTDAVGGKFKANPAWTALGAQQITVHPIGGARVSADGTGRKGVTNHAGEIFTGEGSATHAGLIVCDGAAMPAALGVNPFATITAFAERSVEYAAQRLDLSIDYDTTNGLLDLFGSPAYPIPRDTSLTKLSKMMLRATETNAISLSFSEVMTGFIHTGHDIKDFETATNLARSRCESARLFLTINSWDTTDSEHLSLASHAVKANSIVINNDKHEANITGTFSCSLLGGVFIVHRGTFRLFNQDPRQAETANLTYDFDMVSPGGRKLHFNGYKVVNSASFLSPRCLWRQTTTLFVTISDIETSLVVARGSLSMDGHDLVDELRSFELGGSSLCEEIKTSTSFARYFAKQLSVPFLSTLGQLQWPKDDLEAPPDPMSPSKTVSLKAVDGVRSTLLMWDSISRKSDIFQTILFIPGAVVDHTIFALPTLAQNTITYFREAGYRTYCLTHRTGRTDEAREGYTPYDTRLDILAAVTHIRSLEDSRKIYVVAHCIGSLAFACGLLDGTIPAEWIIGATCSAVFMNPRFGRVNHLASSIPIGVYKRILGSYYDCRSRKDDSLGQQALNQVLRLYPVGSRRETCRSVVCHRSELCFSRLWNHENLNEATHKNLHQFLGGVSMRSMGWITNCGRIERVTTNVPTSTNLVTPENLQRLQGVPILFVAGADNVVYSPENTDTSYTTLCNVHGRRWYQREVFPDTGHLDTWMGTHSHRVVYPRIRRHVEEVVEMQSQLQA